MPDQQSSQSPPPGPVGQPLAVAGPQATIEERLTALEAGACAKQKVTTPRIPLADVRIGEWWMIGINGMLFLAQVVIAFVYIAQLNQMRIATNASTEATRLENESLQYSTSQFDRSMVQITRQTAAQYKQTEQAIIAAQAAKSAANVAKRTLIETVGQFRVQNRAYLIPGDPEEKGGGYGLLRIPIRNYGHVSAKHSVLRLTFLRISSIGPTIRDRRTLVRNASTDITPGDVPTYTWLIFAPNTISQEDRSAIGRSQQTLEVRGTITYDDGFGITTSVDVCYGFQNIHN